MAERVGFECKTKRSLDDLGSTDGTRKSRKVLRRNSYWTWIGPRKLLGTGADRQRGNSNPRALLWHNSNIHQFQVSFRQACVSCATPFCQRPTVHRSNEKPA